ncbi:unnamed protein product, partial [Polarella glacialis]
SGLILVAKSYEAYNDMLMQMAKGEVVRDYLVLCHGWLSHSRTEILARVHWWTTGRETASRVCPAGKPASTRLKLLARAELGGQALSLIAIRIDTGRRHQIRLHTAHIGHPTVCDGKYTGPTTRSSDCAWCPRTFLHRYRLSFFSGQNCEEVSQTLPPELWAALAMLAAAEPRSAAALRSFASTRPVQPWHEIQPLAPVTL